MTSTLPNQEFHILNQENTPQNTQSSSTNKPREHDVRPASVSRAEELRDSVPISHLKDSPHDGATSPSTLEWSRVDMSGNPEFVGSPIPLSTLTRADHRLSVVELQRTQYDGPIAEPPSSLRHQIGDGTLLEALRSNGPPGTGSPVFPIATPDDLLPSTSTNCTDVSPPIFRDIRGFNASETAKVREAYRLSYQMMVWLHQYIYAISLLPLPVRGTQWNALFAAGKAYYSLKSFFGTYNKHSLETLLNVLDHLEGRYQNPNLRILRKKSSRWPCTKTVNGVQLGGYHYVKNRVRICSDYLSVSVTKLAQLILHEFLHNLTKNPTGLKDEYLAGEKAYGEVKALTLAAENPYKAVRNPDNYTNAALRQLNGLKISCNLFHKPLQTPWSPPFSQPLGNGLYLWWRYIYTGQAPWWKVLPVIVKT